jgi:hypothetical protein
MRKGDWIQTYTGRQFWPLDPRMSEVHIEDIAHALSLACRYNGHCLEFYSVAQHSVLLARYVAPKYKLWALLHDAAEAYLSDVPRPLKANMPIYKAQEDALMKVICKRFGLPPTMPEVVHECDTRILMDERHWLMRAPPATWGIDAEPLGIRIIPQHWRDAKRDFLFMFNSLRDDRRLYDEA